MKDTMKHILPLILLILISLPVLAKDWTEYYFQFEIQDKSELDFLTDIISLAKVQGNVVWAFANDEEWQAFQQLNYHPQLLQKPGYGIEQPMRDVGDSFRDWYTYPTYEAYVAQMYAFASNYPNLCQIYDIGTTVNGRKILFAKISDNVSLHEAEPEVQYSATIHGDETCGYMTMLHLIDYLLSNYSTNPRIQNLINNLEIWINPLANPDGTYYGGNNSVSGARRYNANGYDLNRSFPDHWGTPSAPTQPETTIFTNFANTHHFVLSANFHGGAEVVNYPWDGTYTPHIDENWFIDLSADYVNTARQVYSNYMTSLYSTGYTNGADWYIIHGGRQDYFTYFHHCREVTIELTNTYITPAAQLENYWNYNYNSLLGYLENALYGLQGTVKDVYGNPLTATITVLGLDTVYSTAITDPACGDYIRMLLPGTYNVQISVNGYEPQTFNNTVITEGQKTTLNAVFGVIPPSQTLQLNAGWNLISFNIQPNNLNIESILSPVMGNVIQIKNIKESFHPAMDSYYNTITNLDITYGYWIKMNSSTSLYLEGTPIDPSTHPINLKTGWNLVPYYPENILSVISALQSITLYLQEVKYFNQVYIPESINNSLTQMEPGNGYWIRVLQDCNLIYPAAKN